MRKVMICDDNQVTARDLEMLIRQMCEVDIEIKKIILGEELLLILEDRSYFPDILFLDIKLEDGNGIEIAKKIQSQYPSIRLIFITGYFQFVQDVFQINPIYLLLKPIQKDKLKDAWQKAVKSIEKSKKTVTIPIRGDLVRLNGEDIQYAESNGRVLSLVTEEKIFRTYMKMDDFVKLAPSYFLRTHQSYIVNINFIHNFSANGIVLNNGSEIPISKYRYKDVKKKFLDYLNALD